ncbi:hypothetical protein TanjilG_12521 [Lupinus angustifolius]|uniref:Protein arginine N-methyltransferase n=1 Tax=Lupinus angustifolius TaxID=3871 RepID=A0A4P1QYG8_LUPAN|nr:hypothetical protein TanjilG_12521 [Lupinus angustifolius]
MPACVLPAPKGTTCANYARIPVVKNDGDSMDATSDTLVDSWETWNSFRLLCEHHSQLCVALDILNSLPSENSLARWFGESVRAAIINTHSFLTNARGYPCLSKRHQKLITRFFNHSIQIIISGNSVHPKARLVADVSHNHSVSDSQRHPLRPYLDYVGYLYQKMDPLPEQERFELGYRDFLQAPLQYQRAVCKALLDRVPDEEASVKTTVLMVVGAGRGPLVRASLQAAEETGRKLKVYAVEKNPNAIVTLHALIKLEGWEDIVTIVSSDMRSWNAPEEADILVSELLGSFGDNELSPECLDGAERFLKQDGISIPSSYTSFLQPVTSSKLYNDVKAHKDLAHFETAYVVKIHNAARLAPSQPVFTFTHPKPDKESNDRYKKMHFVIPNDTGSAMVHGFAGYFDATLYKDVHLGIEPSTATPNMFSWFAIFFPLRSPIYVGPGSTLEVNFWRCSGPKKVWYEWCVTSPTPSPIHNTNGRSYWVGL